MSSLRVIPYLHLNTIEKYLQKGKVKLACGLLVRDLNTLVCFEWQMH